MAILVALHSIQQSNEIQKQESSMLDHGYSLELQSFMECQKMLGGFAPKKIKEDCDCVIMRWNNIGFIVEHKNKK